MNEVFSLFLHLSETGRNNIQVDGFKLVVQMRYNLVQIAEP